ncbi:hypothetical protein [Geodermatophilus sp. DSM 44513]|uniref:hypothetical protein n=1 Tax=Geodermatophilus sp. DSM 44513 TaxID=1528104 RepID=UPI001273F814|nr:hypothetical protein [Geodermatophilus sp. DSM 44513]WNV76914.1 hypothetical protein RTG05_06465 [Geodermatophilus sp. DSM 44513]
MGCWVAVCGPDGSSLRARAEVEHRVLGLGAALGGAPWVATHVVRAATGGHHAGSLAATADAAAAADVLAGAVGADHGWAVVGDDGVEHTGGADGHREHAAASAVAHRDRTEGRVLRFPGQDELPALLPLADVVATTVVEEVLRVGVPDDPALVLRTNGYVRLRLAGGRVQLPVTPWDDGEVCPFEQADSHPCCGGHH